jgi:hypothetical protein
MPPYTHTHTHTHNQIATSSEAEAVKNDALKAELLSAMETLRDEAATAANTTATAIAAAGELTAVRTCTLTCLDGYPDLTDTG